MVHLYGDEPDAMSTLKVSIDLKGAKELARKLDNLPKRVEKKVLRQALRSGMRPIHMAAQAYAPIDTGKLKRSIKLRAIKRNRKGFVGVKITTGSGFFRGEEFYGAFQEFGWRQGPRRLGNQRRQVPGKHFFLRAANNKKDQAAGIVTQEIASGIIREAKAL